MGSSKKVTVGYKYYVGMHMILCHGPVDRLLRIQVDERDVWDGRLSGGQIALNQPNVFGGESREGGIQGAVDFEAGHAAQEQNSYLLSKLGSYVPSFRGVAGMVLRQIYVGMNPYLKKWSFRLQRIHTRQNGLPQWHDSKAEISGLGVGANVNETFSNTAIFESNDPAAYIVEQNSIRNSGSAAGSVSSFYKRQIPTLIIKSFSVEFLVERLSAGDSMRIAIASDNGTAWFSFNPVREAFVDALQRPMINGNHAIATDKLDVNVWYRLEVNANVSPGNLGYKITRLSDSATISTGQYPQPQEIAVSQLMFVRDQDSSPSITRFKNVLIVGAGTTGDMNPAHIIRECLTDPLWGMGYLEADIDDLSFMAAADTLYAEGFGMSLLWDTETSIEEFIKIIVKHIDASVYVDRKTGRFVLKLIRDDYNPANLLTLNESNVEKIADFNRPSIGELINSVTVTYWNSETGQNATLTVQDIALSQQQQSTVGTSVTYEGITNAHIASRVAQRDLKTLSTPLASCTIYANRAAAGLNVGDVFKLTWPVYDLTDMVMRVTGIAYGDGRSHRVRIQCVQDAFATPDSAIIVPPPIERPDTGQEPVPIARYAVFEVPYFELVQRQGQPAIDALLAGNPDMGFVGAGAARPQGAALSARIYTDMGNGYEDVSNLDFSPCAVLDEAIDQMATTFAIREVQDIEAITLGTWFQLGTELMSVESITTSSITVKRGVLDTVPASHSDGDSLIFWDEYGEADPTEYIASEQINVKLLTVTGAGRLALANAPQDTVTLDSRALRPYPPGNFKINGSYFPNAVSGPVSLSWVERNRLQQTGAVLIGFSDGTVTPETGTTYSVYAYDDSNNDLKYSNTGITGISDVIGVGFLAGVINLRVELYAVRDGYQSLQPQTHVMQWSSGENMMTFENNYTPDAGNSVQLQFTQ